jgi:ankyrin repeat protein
MEALLGVKARALRSPNFASALVAVSEGIMLCFIRRKAQRCCFCSRPFVSQAPEGSRSDINGTSNSGDSPLLAAAAAGQPAAVSLLLSRGADVVNTRRTLRWCEGAAFCSIQRILVPTIALLM